MAIRKIKIENFKKFEIFELEFTDGLNILVGDNEVGKSTILEAIHLVLTGMINGKYLNTELTQYLFNNKAVERYIADPKSILPPKINIELYFSDSVDSLFMGGINSDRNNTARGIEFSIELEENDEYRELLKNEKIKTLPIEYYEYKWRTFADKIITTRSISVKSAMIDSSLAKYQNGSDIYISRIIRQILEDSEKVKIAQAHRSAIDTFGNEPSVIDINKKISDKAKLSGKKITITAERLSKNAWENSLITCVDKIPFHYIGKGEQCVIKTKLALNDKKSIDASIILMEEPENHLTHTRLNQLLDVIQDSCKGQQIIISTHSSFVANKLGLENLILLGQNGDTSSFQNLSDDTANYFKKLSGYNTLRLVLSKASLLVEGPSDELVVQKAYLNSKNTLPIHDGIDVIDVGGLTFKRYLEIASLVDKRIAVITDNDGDVAALEEKYSAYLGENEIDSILISYDKENHTPSNDLLSNYNYNTLENLMLLSNGRTNLNKILKKKYKTDDELRIYMKSNKTDCALSIFEHDDVIKFPKYIEEAVGHVTK